MITTNNDHIALLASRTFWGVDLYEFAFLDGTFLRVQGDTGAMSTTWGGNVFAGGGPIIKRDGIRKAVGLEASELALTISPHDDDLLLGLPMRIAASNGAFSGASLTLWRGHAATPGGVILGAPMLFGGNVESVKVEQDISIALRSATIAFDAPTPRAVYGPGCDRTLYKPGCGVSRAAFQTNTTAANLSTRAVVRTGLTAAADYYAGGELRFTGGANAGARRTIKRHAADGTLTLAYPLSFDVVAGDSFTIWPGCSHANDATGCVKFSNSARFRGQPFVPAPETAY
jgi:uncharacterized phage protein (TIGR02218 family)